MMDDFKMNIHILRNQERVQDLTRVHDITKKQKKEKRQTGDEKEFREFLEESEQEIVDGFQDFTTEEQQVTLPPQRLLDILGAHSGPPLIIEPIEPVQAEHKSAPDTEQSQSSEAEPGAHPKTGPAE